MDAIIISVTGSLTVTAICAACAWASRMFRVGRQDRAAQRRYFELVDEALRALLFDKIARLHADTVEHGLPASVEVKRRADVAWRAYRALDPDETLDDGTCAHLHSEIVNAHVSTMSSAE